MRMKLPILDLKVWIEKKEMNGTKKEKVMHKLYRKPMSNPLLIMARSAMPEKVKRTALTQQALRILRNTSLDLPDNKKAELMSDFSARMRARGYGARYRQEIITSAMIVFDKMKKEQENGGRPINRPRSYQAEERQSVATTVLFVPTTHGGRLANMLQEVEERSGPDRGWRIKIIDRGGQKLSSNLTRDPWAGPCNKEDCLVCHSAKTRPDRKRGGPCSRNSCCYLIECRDCRNGWGRIPSLTRPIAVAR